MIYFYRSLHIVIPHIIYITLLYVLMKLQVICVSKVKLLVIKLEICVCVYFGNDKIHSNEDRYILTGDVINFCKCPLTCSSYFLHE